MSADKVRLSLDVSPELNRILDELATKIHSTKSDVLRKAIVLMELAVQAKDHEQKLGDHRQGPSCGHGDCRALRTWTTRWLPPQTHRLLISIRSRKQGATSSRSKVRKDPDDARHRRRKDLLLVSVALLGLCAIGFFCL